jgi:hypothetical protein
MTGLLLLSLPWAALGWARPRPWALVLPVAFWLAFAWLGSIGVLPGGTSLAAALLAGVLGAVFAVAGVLARSWYRMRPA